MIISYINVYIYTYNLSHRSYNPIWPLSAITVGFPTSNRQRMGQVECHGTGTALGDPIEAYNGPVRWKIPERCMITRIRDYSGEGSIFGFFSVIQIVLSWVRFWRVVLHNCHAQVGALGATLQEGREEPLLLLAGKTNVRGPMPAGCFKFGSLDFNRS